MALHYSPPPDGAALPPAAPKLRWLVRLVLAISGAVLLGLLATAAWLTPSSDGYGTHRQLGLPPCTIVAWFGMRCPSCGMTTSWSHLMHGQPLLAFRANAGGALLGLVAAVCGPWLLVSGVVGRWVVGPPREMVALAIGLAIVLTTLIDWVLRLPVGS